MRRDNVNYLLAGTFVLLMAAVLLVVLYRVTGRTGPVDLYHVHYRNVSGLKYGTATSYEGYQLGQVERIVPEPDEAGMRYRVEFSVQQGWRIPKDSLARIVTTGLISAVSIDIAEGESEELLAPGSELQGREQANLFAVMNDVAADFRDLSETGLKPALANFNQQLDTLVGELTALSRDEVRPLVGEVRRQVTDTDLLARVEKLVVKLDASAEALQSMVGERNRRRLDSLLGNLDEGSVELKRLVSNVELTRAKTHGLLEKLELGLDRGQPGLQGGVEDLREAAADLRTTMRVVSDNVDTVMHQLDGTTRNMQELSRELRNNPGALLRNAPPLERGETP